MNRQILILALSLGVSWWGTGCGNGEAGGKEPGAALVQDTSASSSFVDREFWLALAEEPGWHLNAARDLFLEGQTEGASKELVKVAAILNFESRHSHSPREEGLLLGSVQELREVALELKHEDKPLEGPPSTTELDHVEALAFRTIAAHQVALARDALEAGDARMASRYILEVTRAVEAGFQRSGEPMGSAMAFHLKQARQVASQLESEGDGSLEEGLATLDHLDTAEKELGEVLTSRRV